MGTTQGGRIKRVKMGNRINMKKRERQVNKTTEEGAGKLSSPVRLLGQAWMAVKREHVQVSRVPP